MKHRSTIAIFSEWQRLAQAGTVPGSATGSGMTLPAREAIEPRRLGRHLSDLFFVESDANGELVFRLGGTMLCTLFGRELKGLRLLSLWPERDRPALAELAENVGTLQVPALSLHDGISLSGRSLSFEMLLAPLESASGRPSLLGSIGVLDQAVWAGADPLVLGHLKTVEPIDPALVLAEQMPRAALSTGTVQNRRWSETRVTAAQPRKFPKLRVINGGKA